MKYKILFIIISLMCFTQVSWAQKIDVSGKVVDETGVGMPSVTVVIEGTTTGTVTNIDGEFSLEVDPENKLIFSFIGYQTQILPVNTSRKMKVRLKEDIEEISDVVVIGYGTQKRESVVGAISDVSGTELRKTGLNNLSQMIQNQLPGVFTELKSGQPGDDDANIIIRGVATLGDNKPLILIDGVEATAGFSQIDAGEVASISVLKDGASTAIYGSKGANGVILITTRRGTLDAPSIMVSGSVTAKTVAETPDQMGSYDVLMLGQEAIKNNNMYSTLRSQWYIDKFLDPDRNMYAYPDIDWYDLMMKKVGWEENARVNVSGGTKFVKYFAAISAVHQGDVLKDQNTNGYYNPEFSFTKYNFRTNLDFQLTPTTTLRTDISGRSEFKRMPNTNVGSNEFDNLFKHINITPPYVFPAYYPAEFVQEYPDPLAPDAGWRLASGNGLTPYIASPYNSAYHSGMKKFKKDVVDFQLGLTQDLSFITKGLSASARYNYSTAAYYKKEERLKIPTWLYDAERDQWQVMDGQSYNENPPIFKSSGGESFQESVRDLYYEAKIMYNRSFGFHNVDIVGVFNRSEKRKKPSYFPSYHEDWVGRFSYDYDEKYMIEATAAYNGSERFALGKRFGFFPGAAVGWNIAKEEFVKDNLPWINSFKVRYSFGESGSEQGDRFLYQGGWTAMHYKLGYMRFGFPSESLLDRYAETKIANPNATWETAYKKNLGFDVAMFNKELTFQLDIFNERREGIFIYEKYPTYYHPSFGQGDKSGSKISPPPVNLGETKSQGFDFAGNYSHVTSFGLSYSFGGNITVADSRIVYKADYPFRPDYLKDAGKPIGWFSRNYTIGFINTFEEAVNLPQNPDGNYPGKYIWSDFNADGKIDSNLDKIPSENTKQPLIAYGFNLGSSYRGFDLNIRFSGKGGVVYPASGMFWFPNFDSDLFEAKTFHADRWAPENTDARFPAYTNTGGSQYWRSNLTELDGSYLKLQSVTLSYQLNSAFLKDVLRIQNMKLRLSGENLYTWTNVPFGDPEGGNNLASGFGNYPLVRRYIFGVDIQF